MHVVPTLTQVSLVTLLLQQQQAERSFWRNMLADLRLKLAHAPKDSWAYRPSVLDTQSV